MSAAPHENFTAPRTVRLPFPRKEWQVTGFDGRALLADDLAAAALLKADEVYLGLSDFMAGGDRTLGDLVAYIGTHGMVLMEAWASTMALAGTDREPWAREAASRAIEAYRDRLDELMTASGVGVQA